MCGVREFDGKKGLTLVGGYSRPASNLLLTPELPPILPEMTDTLTVDGRAETIKKIVQLPAAGVSVAL